ncbi:ATP-binding cassette domain-containing protein [Oscillospiraceae bacterium OttesenSCG-928-F05]|nr:ATP-binding cassette domain-containing protein [Oscillospiraceae bacterium OttesenSCG-928-F05]
MLELRNVSFEVAAENGAGSKEILKDINLSVESGHFLVITGPNGGGKSTLAKIIMGIEMPTSGQILFNGEDITALDITTRAERGIGFAFQQPVRFKGLFVHDLLNLAAKRKLRKSDACGYLAEVGLCANDYIDREINASLSGGELKRIEIAMLIARGTKLSVFDEPEAGIDLWSFHNLIRVFQKIRDKHKGAVIIISHQERILEIADQVVVIAGGKISGRGTREEILPELLKESDTCRYYREEA